MRGGKVSNQGYTTLSVHVDVASKVRGVRDDLSLDSNTDAVKVLLAAYDIINGTGHGGRFTEAVKKAFAENG